MLRLGLIGFGTIGGTVGRAVLEGKAGDSRIETVLIRDLQKHAADSSRYPWRFTDDPEVLLGEEGDLVVETAGHEGVKRYAVRSLLSGRDFLTISAGAFADEALLAEVREAAIASGRRVLVPSGAIGGLDAIAAAAVAGLDAVTIVTRKPPRAWKGTVAEQALDLSRVAEPALLFSGPARESARLYPQNVNVQAALGLAGIGLDRTKAVVYADPTVRHNTHEIVARGYFGEIKVTISNLPSETSPKTGRIAALSVIKAIRDLTSPIVVGLWNPHPPAPFSLG